MSEESQRAWNQFQIPPMRYEATGGLGRKLKRFAPMLRLTFGFVRRALSTHSIILMSLAGKIVRSLPLFKNHRMKARVGRETLRQVLNCFVSFDLRSSSTATSEPSFENWSPLAIIGERFDLQRRGAGHRNGGAYSRCVATRFFHLPGQLDWSQPHPRVWRCCPSLPSGSEHRQD